MFLFMYTRKCFLSILVDILQVLDHIYILVDLCYIFQCFEQSPHVESGRSVDSLVASVCNSFLSRQEVLYTCNYF